MELCGFKIGWRGRERFERYSSVKRPVLVNTFWNSSRSNLYLGGGKDEEYPVGLFQWDPPKPPRRTTAAISSFGISSALPDYHNRLHCSGIQRKSKKEQGTQAIHFISRVISSTWIGNRFLLFLIFIFKGKFDGQVLSLGPVANCHLPWYHQLILSWHLHQPKSHQVSLNNKKE